MSRAALTALLASTAIIAAACGSGAHVSGQSTGPTSSAPTTATDPAVALTRAARTAVNRLHRLSIEVLWRNTLPSGTSKWIRGPALASLRTSAADRRKRGIRVRLVADDFHIVSVRLDPSYTKATAIARGRQRVRPYGRSGRPLGHAVSLNERARIDLRRVGHSNRFVVWQVVALH
ncbi:MAG: hypothetical protein KGJ43_01310 [Acidobacteriota bacterium]|nr:hypothetical protein [Acidobacteriota bacterium]